MYRIKLAMMFLFVCLQAGSLLAQQFTIPGKWKVRWEDSASFSRADFNDASWQELPALKWSDDHKTTANRTLWIRKKILIPSTLRKEFEKTGLVSLSMGKISQSDDTWLNGKLIGSTGSGDTYRNYLLAQDDILWDQENTIAIKVRHWGSFQVSRTPQFVSASPEHFFVFSSALKNANPKDPVLKQDLTYQLAVFNKSFKEAAGLLRADFYDFAGKKMYATQKDVTLAVGKNEISFPFTSPSPFVKVVYSLSVPVYDYKKSWNASYGYNNIIYKTTSPVVAYKASQKYFAPTLGKQVIGGWLGEKIQVNTEKRLQKVDEDALLAGFINRPGSHSWIGEHIGKFLEAACNAYANKADPALKIQIDRSAQQLIAAQLPDGYLGTYDMDSHWTSWDVWSHRYDLMGLLRYYELSGFKPALTASEKIADLLIKTFGNEKGQKDIIRSGAHVGMAATSILESMGELYRFSGNKKYLDYCYFVVKSFNNPTGPRIISTLDSIGRVDKVANAKAYEMLSNLLGVVKLYRLTNDPQFLKPVVTAWQDISKNRLYVTGTTSSFEHFQDDAVLPATNKDNMGEGCVTTTWVQFNYQLFSITGEMKYLDEIERAVYNHLTGAENPQTGCVSYYTPLIGVKPFGCSITCCMSSVPRGIAMIPSFANGKINNRPSFLFYQPGTYATTVGNSNVSFTTSSDFLKDGRVVIKVDQSAPVPYPIAFRRPYWAKDFAIMVNGKSQKISNTETVSITRVWKKADQISISFTMPAIVLDGGKSYPGFVALQRGPQVMAFDKKINGFAKEGISIATGNILLVNAPASLPAGWIGGQAYQIKASENNTEKNIVLVPYADASQTGGEITTWIKKQN